MSLALPYGQYRPAAPPERGGHATISILVEGKFREPLTPAALRYESTLTVGVLVPEAAVYKYRRTSPHDHCIGRPTEARIVHPGPHAKRAQELGYRVFRFRSAATNPGHQRAAFISSKPIRHGEVDCLSWDGGAMAVVQDDRRQVELMALFNLEKPAGATRSGTDGILHLDGREIPFELKSSTKGSVTTVRDFGPAHVEKWKGKHWLVGFYDDAMTLQYSVYASPQQMAYWVQEKERYVRLDFALAERVPALITLDVMFELLGRKTKYTIEDCRVVQKKQFSAAEYRKQMDQPGGYSPARMLDILRHRCAYVIKRGATLNNPHVPGSFFKSFEKISRDHAATLRRLVRAALTA